MSRNALNIGKGIKLDPTPTASAPTAEDGVLYYDSTLGKFRAREAGAYSDLLGGSGTVNTGAARKIALYPSSGSAVDDVLVQNSQDITLEISAQPGRSAALSYILPNPGNAVTSADIVLTEGGQTINGDKTFGNNVTINGDLTVSGTTTSVNTTNTNVSDKLITLNSGGAAASGGGSGFEIEENAVITAYIKTNSARTGFELKSPNVSGQATFLMPSANQSYTLPAATGTLLTAVSQDTAPSLGGNLNVNSNAIVSASNGNIVVAPNGTGRIRYAKDGALTRFIDEQYIDNVTLTGSTTAVLSALTFDTTVYKSQIVEFQIREATTNRCRVGKLMICADGADSSAASLVSVVQFSSETNDVGVTWAGAMNGNNAEISYTATANNKTIQMHVKRFLQ